MKLTKLEIELVDLIEKARKFRAKQLKTYSEKYGDRIVELKAQIIINGCSHQNLREYTWTWSNGVGSHKQMPGKQCTVCNRINHWPGSNSWARPEDCSRFGGDD